MVGGSPASFPFIVVVVVVAVAMPPLPNVCPCPEDIASMAMLVICGTGGLLCQVIKSCIWLAIRVVMVGYSASVINR
jgi:hypothetical protein